jgi:hypothetical protein
MKVIGAGLPRTATTPQLIALEQLGFGPCYHMRDLLGDLEGRLPAWERAATQGDFDWKQLIGDAESTVDWPASRYWRELRDEYPDAKVLLSVREGNSWVASMRQSVWAMYYGHSVLHYTCEVRDLLDPLWHRFLDLMKIMTWREGTGGLAGETESDEGFIAAMNRWNDEVKSTVPAERLLVWEPGEGWEPLCEFLEVDVPDEPLPHANDIAAFREGIIGGAIGVLNEWWDQRDRPSSGLHGAQLN